MRPKRRSPLQLLPVTLLIFAIAVHGLRIELHNENPQRGSAFAMFATVDVGGTRSVLATVPGDREVTLDVPDALDGLQTRLAHAPSDDSARRFANLLLELRWEVEGDTATVGDVDTFDQVRVQVVGLTTQGRMLSRQVLTDVAVGSSGP